MPVYVVTYFYVPLSYKTKCRLTRSDATDNGYERERESESERESERERNRVIENV